MRVNYPKLPKGSQYQRILTKSYNNGKIKRGYKISIRRI